MSLNWFSVFVGMIGAWFLVPLVLPIIRKVLPS